MVQGTEVRVQALSLGEHEASPCGSLHQRERIPLDRFLCKRSTFLAVALLNPKALELRS